MFGLLILTNLRKTIFENCEFEDADFSSPDMNDLCLDGQPFINVNVENAGLK
ncbi:hypothetical protein EG344_02520 [Chryseobacterium sp. G0162]|nr:hypothetical protein EG344_02520 [Chryseobacterium sp. G0162]